MLRRSNLGHNITMGFHARSDILIGRAAAGSALADEIADLRRELSDPIGLEGIIVVGEPVVFRGANIGRVIGAVFEGVSRAGRSS